MYLEFTKFFIQKMWVIRVYFREFKGLGPRSGLSTLFFKNALLFSRSIFFFLFSVRVFL